MGSLFYGDDPLAIDVDDRALAHLKVVVAAKLRRRESFMLSWEHCPDGPVGRTTVWLHPAIAMRFVFDEPEPPQLNPAWIQSLVAAATTSGGIKLVPLAGSRQLTIASAARSYPVRLPTSDNARGMSST